MGDVEERIKKRLHVSFRPNPPHKTANTLSISEDDIRARLTAFPTISVSAIEGFDLKNGLGDLRGWGYVTIEGTTKGVARCVTSLSGTTWKGARLRIGDAKLDWKERLALERASSPSPPRKKRKKQYNIYAADMSPVTRECAAARGGAWKVTPMGRVLFTLRMRPERPLPPLPLAGKTTVKGNSDKLAGKKRKKVRDPEVRARRRKIDMLRWGSTYLSGIWLDGGSANYDTRHAAGGVRTDRGEQNGEESGDDGFAADMEDMTTEEDTFVLSPPRQFESVTLAQRAPETLPLPKAFAAADLAAEKLASLSLLASMFGDKDGDGGDWMGRESLGSDNDEQALLKGDTIVGEDMNSEEVPQETETVKAIMARPQKDGQQLARDSRKDDEKVKPQGLKALFAPREEDASFSILNHLDLDLELDDGVLFPSTSAPPLPDFTARTSEESFTVPAPTTLLPHYRSKKASTDAASKVFVFNPKQTLFFPSKTKSKGIKDIFDAARDLNCDWRDPHVGFFRTGTEAEIRARWDEQKGELTRGWKKRWREAAKVRRRRGGGDD